MQRTSALLLAAVCLFAPDAKAQSCSGNTPDTYRKIHFFRETAFLSMGILRDQDRVALLNTYTCYAFHSSAGNISIVVNHLIRQHVDGNIGNTASYIGLQVVSIATQKTNTVTLQFNRSANNENHKGAWARPKAPRNRDYLPDYYPDVSRDNFGYNDQKEIVANLFDGSTLSRLLAPSHPEPKGETKRLFSGWHAFLVTKEKEGDADRFVADTYDRNEEWDLSPDEVKNHVDRRSIHIRNYLQLLTPTEMRGNDINQINNRLVQFTIPIGAVSCIYVRQVATDSSPLRNILPESMKYRFVGIQINPNYECPSPAEIGRVASVGFFGRLLGRR